jgi:hypothetical protein
MAFLRNLFNKTNTIGDKYEDFWRWFADNEKAFHKVVKSRKNIEKLFFDKLSPKLNGVRSEVFYLTGMFDNNTVELILTADGAVKNIVFVEELINTAPSIPGWKFTALKPASAEGFSLNMAGYNFNSDNLSFYANEDARYPDEIDLTIVYDHYKEDDRTTITNGVYIFLDNYLGELELATTIDNLVITGQEEATRELIPLTKLKAFLNWREKEFTEKHEGTRHHTDSDNHSILRATLENGKPLFAAVNTDLLKWDAKASHPWILDVEMKFEGDDNGMPDKPTLTMLEGVEDKMLEELKDSDGFLHIGRETANNTRNIYFACQDFRKAAKLTDHILASYKGNGKITYEIYKDKYWQSFNRFVIH